MALRKTPKIGALVQVTWVDSARHLGGNDGWVQREDLSHDVMTMASVGWVWAISDASITLAPHVDMEQTQAYGVLSIPCCAVVDIVSLRHTG